jgi:hypothetical protein
MPVVFILYVLIYVAGLAAVSAFGARQALREMLALMQQREAMRPTSSSVTSMDMAAPASSVREGAYSAGAGAAALGAESYTDFLSGFVIFPLLMHLVQTRTRRLVPPTVERTFCRFGRNLRFVFPVTLTPTPPLYLARPRYVYW